MGYITIETVEPVQLDRLTDQDAIPDGFSSVRELRAEILSIYPRELEQGFRAFRVCFKVLPEKEQNRIRAEKTKLKQLKSKEEKKKGRKTKTPTPQEQMVEKTMQKLRDLMNSPESD